MIHRVRRVLIVSIAALLCGGLVISLAFPGEVDYADADVDRIDITAGSLGQDVRPGRSAPDRSDVPPAHDVSGLLPSDDVDAARDVFNCDLGHELCEVLFEQLLELPFGWHITGYEYFFAGREAVHGVCSTTGVDSRGCVRTTAREVHVGVPFEAEFGTEGFRLMFEMYPVLRTFTHEVAHTLHTSCASAGIEEAKLSAYAEARGLPEGIAVRGHTHGPYTSIAEDFAETAMLWLTRDHKLTFYSRSPYGEPEPDVLEELGRAYFGLCR